MPHILLVEDSAVNREMMLRRLQRRGYDVDTAVDGVEAVERAQADGPDLILMDVGLPRLDGLTATRQLRADARTAATPIIALTAHDTEEGREAARAAGCDEYITKPVDLPELLGKIEGLLGGAGGAA